MHAAADRKGQVDEVAVRFRSPTAVSDQERGRLFRVR
jgi:hypothetical protein